ncbi:MAG: hypothetical protein R2750_01730 [Bacteroidales bacterium]
MVNFYKYLRILPGLIAILMFVSCEKFKGGQTIPSYIRIDSVVLMNNTQVEAGNYLTQNFTDVWIYVDDQSIGAFELRGTHADDPLIIPILEEGVHKLTVYAGIKLNGISSTRLAYPMVKPVIYEDFLFTVDSITNVFPYPSVSYYETSTFAWIEEFEDASLTLDETNNSDTVLTTLQHTPVSATLGHQSGIAWVDDKNPVFEVITVQNEVPGFVLPGNGQPVALEIDFNISVHMAIGLYITRISGDDSQHPVLILNPTNNEWKKVYVNFTATIEAYPGGDYYNVYFRAENQSYINVGEIKIDNLKLVYRG